MPNVESIIATKSGFVHAAKYISFTGTVKTSVLIYLSFNSKCAQNEFKKNHHYFSANVLDSKVV